MYTDIKNSIFWGFTNIELHLRGSMVALSNEGNHKPTFTLYQKM